MFASRLLFGPPRARRSRTLTSCRIQLCVCRAGTAGQSCPNKGPGHLQTVVPGCPRVQLAAAVLIRAFRRCWRCPNSSNTTKTAVLSIKPAHARYSGCYGGPNKGRGIMFHRVLATTGWTVKVWWLIRPVWPGPGWPHKRKTAKYTVSSAHS